jgi:hypothetical protein
VTRSPTPPPRSPRPGLLQALGPVLTHAGLARALGRHRRALAGGFLMPGHPERYDDGDEFVPEGEPFRMRGTPAPPLCRS